MGQRDVSPAIQHVRESNRAGLKRPRETTSAWAGRSRGWERRRREGEDLSEKRQRAPESDIGATYKMFGPQLTPMVLVQSRPDDRLRYRMSADSPHQNQTKNSPA